MTESCVGRRVRTVQSVIGAGPPRVATPGTVVVLVRRRERKAGTVCAQSEDGVGRTASGRAPDEWHPHNVEAGMIRKLKSGEYRLYSRKANPKTGKRRNLGTFKSRKAAEQHERAVQFFKRH